MISVTDESGVRTIAFDRPEQRNALTPEMLGGLASALADEAGGARAVVLRGSGKVFCAGFDLTLCRHDPDGAVMRTLLTGLSAAIGVMRACPVPIVLCAHGAAVAGGAALLGGADVVVADRNTKIGYPVVRIGISPAVSAPFLRAGVGDGPARVRLVDSRLVDGERAAELGLVHHLTEAPDEAELEAARIGAEFASKPEQGLRATKALLNELDGASEDAERALRTSLSLTGGPEERRMLEAYWNRT